MRAARTIQLPRQVRPRPMRLQRWLEEAPRDLQRAGAHIVPLYAVLPVTSPLFGFRGSRARSPLSGCSGREHCPRD